MKQLYNIYAGLSGGFGGQVYHQTVECYNQKDADLFAREIAINEYESYEGDHGIYSYEDCLSEVEHDFNEDDFDDFDEFIQNLEDRTSERYSEEVENWIEWEAILASEDVREEE